MAAAAAPGTLGRTEFSIWGGRAVVAVCERGGLDAALARVKRTIADFDSACSSFREDSELARLNATPGEDVAVSSLLFTAVQAALRAAQLTGGAVSPTVGEALVAHRVNPPVSGQSVRIAPAPAHTVVVLNEDLSTIRVPAGVTLDLGATAKALAADMAAQAAANAGGCGVLVSLCGDIAVAGTAPPEGWKIRVTDDHRDGDAPGQTVAISSGGLATSSVTVRRSGHGAEAVHHLIDPASGRPAAGRWRTASVTAGSCLDANIASTAAIILGAGAPDWLDQHGLSARLVSDDGGVRHVGGWPSEGDDL